MGGGAVLRSIGRVIGAGGTGRAGVGAAAKSPGQKMRIPSSYTMVDDWEFAGDEDGFEAHPHAVLDDHRHVRDRLIFGSAPTQQEVLEATSDLQDAIKHYVHKKGWKHQFGTYCIRGDAVPRILSLA